MSEFDTFISTLAGVISEDRLPEDVERNLKEQQITTEERFLLLDGDDLKELGFLMGPRKQLLQWIQSENAKFTPGCITPRRTVSPSQQSIDSLQSINSPQTTTPVPSTAVPGTRLRKFQNFPVDQLLEGKSTKRFDGAALVQRLEAGVMYQPQERSFLTKTVCRYLMAHCQTQDDPTMQDKVDMAQSIVNTFPVLKDPVTGGCGEFCDPKSHTGYINYYVRCVRSRSADITTRWTHSMKRKLDAVDDNDDAVRVLRERRPNASNRSELLQLMGSTREERRLWITSTSPSITDILHKYPRFQDLDTALKEEFAFIAPDSKSLMAEFQPLKSKVLQVARGNQEAASILAVLEDEADEDKKSEVALKCVLVMLRAPPKRGVKVPQSSPAARISYFFNESEDSTVEEAVVRLRERGCLQPCLFRTADGHYYLKCDNIAVPLPSASCFADAVEFLFFSFWVFSVQYPAPLRFFYTFLERLVGVGQQRNSAVLRDLFRVLADV